MDIQFDKIRVDDIARAAGGSKIDLAKKLKVTTQAVYAWGEFLPLSRAYRLYRERPEWFATDPDPKQEQAA